MQGAVEDSKCCFGLVVRYCSGNQSDPTKERVKLMGGRHTFVPGLEDACKRELTMLSNSTSNVSVVGYQIRIACCTEVLRAAVLDG